MKLLLRALKLVVAFLCPFAGLYTAYTFIHGYPEPDMNVPDMMNTLHEADRTLTKRRRR
jgi:hypothetical protein